MSNALRIISALSLLTIAASLSVLVARSTFASIPDSGGVIHACYSNGGYGTTAGDLRVIDTAPKFPAGSQSCKPGETPISWNQSGAAGAPGTNGTDGTNGTNGVSGYEVVSSLVNDSAPTGETRTFLGFHLSCPTGKKVLGGGGFAAVSNGSASSGIGSTELSTSYPFGGGVEWDVAFTKQDGTDFASGEGVSGTIFAVCATMAP